MQVVFAWAAKADLVSIIEYIAPHNPRAAHSLVDDIESLCLGPLARHPHMGKAYRDNIRVFYKRGYRIFYQVTEEQIEILRVIHSARDEYRV